MTDFEGIVPPLCEALTARGYDVLTPVQIAVSAPELIDADALVSAQTGSGKTVAFGIAIAPTLLEGAQSFDRASHPLALVVAPTRELALQVSRELEWLYAKTNVTMATCVGGMDMRTERRTLERGVHIVVGTPGRLRDHIERGSLELGSIRAVVLDEADEMLDLGFRDDLEYILDASPKTRRTLMFSATVPRTIANLAKRYQRDAVRVETTAEREQHHDIDYQGLVVAPNDRENAIINVLRYFDAKNALVFCATRATVNHMTSRLNNRGFSVVALSGELSQNERTHALQAMRDGRARVCVATDVAARGIDLPNLDLVIHADIPRNSEALLHRSGRTGRAGRKGVSALIVPHNARRKAERLLGNANIEANWAKPPSLEDITKRDRERILDDTSLTDVLTDEEQIFAQELLGRHSAEHVAAAYLRMHTALQPAPEELLDAAPMDAPKPRREDFKNGSWFSLSVGRNDQAEARWLLPMLCRAGHITKNEIGAIRIQQTETYFELAPDGVDKFLKAVGPHMKVEKDIVITRLEGVPAVPAGGRGGRPDRGARPDRGDRGGRGDKGRFEGKKKPYQGSNSDREEHPTARPKRPFVKSNDAPEGAPSNSGKPYAGGGNKPYEKDKKKPHEKDAKKPWDKDAKKPYDKDAKKPYSKDGKKPYAKDAKKPWDDKDSKPKRAYGAGASDGAAKRDGAGERNNSGDRKKPWDKNDKVPKRSYGDKPSGGLAGKKPKPKFAVSSERGGGRTSSEKTESTKMAPVRREDKKSWATDPSVSNPKKKAFRGKGSSKSRPAKKNRPDRTGAAPLKRKKPSSS